MGGLSIVGEADAVGVGVVVGGCGCEVAFFVVVVGVVVGVGFRCHCFLSLAGSRWWVLSFSFDGALPLSFFFTRAVSLLGGVFFSPSATATTSVQW